MFNQVALPYTPKKDRYAAFTWISYVLVEMGLDEVSEKTLLRASEPSLAVCCRWAEATPRCTMQRAMAAQRWWSCCSRPMHRWMCKTRAAGGLSSVATCSGPSWRVTVCLEIGIHRSFQQKSHLPRQPPSVHTFRV